MEFSPGNYYWYVPEHEQYGRTQFYSQPNFQSSQVRVARTQRFRLLGGSKGWAMIEFDVAGKAFVHFRILNNIAHDPGASDPWYEFKRASLFDESPSRVEARLKPASPAMPESAGDPKVPGWKRYKEGWNIKPSRTLPGADAESVAADATSPRTAVEKKPRNKYPLLPPIGSEPANAESAPADGIRGDPTANPTAER
jgi:hypothetical protein